MTEIFGNTHNILRALEMGSLRVSEGNLCKTFIQAEKVTFPKGDLYNIVKVTYTKS